MKIYLVVIGKTEERYIEEGIQAYLKRIQHYLPVEVLYIPPVKASSAGELKAREAELLKKKLKEGSRIILLDENGKERSSAEFAGFLQKLMLSGSKLVYFMIGGAYGFHEDLYKLAEERLSLSKMTLTHDMARLVFTEQLYRALTILKGEKYHH